MRNGSGDDHLHHPYELFYFMTKILLHVKFSLANHRSKDIWRITMFIRKEGGKT